MQTITELAKRTRLLIMDVDGVLTDGRIFITASGEELKAFNTLDGHGLRMLQSTGVQLAIITGRDAPGVAHRARGLGIDHYYAGVHDKRTAFAELLHKTGLTAEDCAYIGDDVIDLPVMSRVGLAVAVPDAPSFVRQHAHFVTGCSGGQGAVRELCELILQAQGNYDRLMAGYLA
ncbi:3-deoxy-D-manno-octulosonate 8-phosphate phosphatase [Vogesella sp. EB]|uniref:3-deoxy-D-manno-octulosonate 8-phosphate phosphatase KdsC n=1 Tax=Vogesella indigofera TaxID=45465 RepID=A0A495B1H8_VOGIN|nr:MULTISPECIES: 3-deoxy-manno-octulosonate-8-phosphatase KdsC [Vogesella]KMJ54123.1 3-deoxy-D-manno-octulosonate 8-phosphate phosphatase [Vogesella sp. EB]RKQ54822.1 3-deoxy-D-manno-octulosonate 8-phosphate phosphatase (KDO 8-P phosphatase) [Vogesella indigofera]